MKAAYQHQRNNARVRGIAFDLTYEQWIKWWEDQLGPDWFAKRGCRRGQYVMARHGDRGPYALDNIKCILAQDNHIEYNLNRKPCRSSFKRLPDELVRAVYLSDLPYSELVDEFRDFNLTKHKIQMIKNKKYYSKITKDLGQAVYGRWMSR